MELLLKNKTKNKSGVNGMDNKQFDQFALDTKIINFDNHFKKDKIERDKNVLLPVWPFRMLVCGGSGTGKTNFVFTLMFKIENLDNIFIFLRDELEDKYFELQKRFEMLKEKREEEGNEFNFVITNDLTLIPEVDIFEEKNKRSLIIFDDLITVKDKSINKRINDLFVRGRKRNISSIYISQNYKDTNDTIKKNSNYLAFIGPMSAMNLSALGKEYRAHLDMPIFKKLYLFCTKNRGSAFFIDTMNYDMRFRRNLNLILTDKIINFVVKTPEAAELHFQNLL